MDGAGSVTYIFYLAAILYCTVVALASVQTAEMSMMLCYVLFICKRYAARTNNGVFPLRKERNKK